MNNSTGDNWNTQASETGNNTIRWFRRASTYMNLHRGKTFVFGIPGDAMIEPHMGALVQDLCLLHSLGVKVVICYGAKKQIDATIYNKDMAQKFHNGNRITDEATMDIIMGVTGRLRALLEAKFSIYSKSHSTNGRSITAVSGNLLSAKSIGVVDGVDMMYTGNIKRVYVDKIQSLLDSDHVVIIPNVAHSNTGHGYNLSMIETTRDIAKSLHANKIIMFHNTDYMDEKREYLLQEALDTTHDNEPYQLTFHALAQAVKGGVRRAHILPFENHDALLTELFTPKGFGSMITATSSETIRPATAVDVGNILEMSRPLEEAGVLFERSQDIIKNSVETFLVVEVDKSIAGCVSLKPYEDEKMGEFSCFIVREYYQKTGISNRLYKGVIEKARTLGLQSIFALTTQTAYWFEDKGWQEISVDDLPKSRANEYDTNRNSKIFKLDLSDI